MIKFNNDGVQTFKTSEPVKMWQKVWRIGVAPNLSLGALRLLRDALDNDDACLVQGVTTLPYHHPCALNWPVEAACILGFCGWQDRGLETVDEVEKFFVRMCSRIDRDMNEIAACRYFLDWFDETPRDEMRKKLFDEVCRAIEGREK